MGGKGNKNERERERKGQEDDRRQETRAEKLRESPGLLDSEVSGGRSPACCQLVSLSAHARWHRGDRRPRMDSHTDASRRGRTHDATMPDAYCYDARTLFRMRVKSETSSGPALGTRPLRGLHAAPSLVAESCLSIRFHEDLLKVAFGQGCIPRLVRFLIMMPIIAITPALCRSIKSPVFS